MLSSLAGNVRAALLVWAVLAWAAAAAMTQNAMAQEAPPPYRLQPGDTILVSVLEDPELDREVLILPDGRISLPVAGSMVAAGRTPVELQSVIRGRLRSNFVKPPSVTVAVSELAPESEDAADLNEVFVLGEVASPGRYEYDAEKPISVMKATARSKSQAIPGSKPVERPPIRRGRSTSAIGRPVWSPMSTTTRAARAIWLTRYPMRWTSSSQAPTSSIRRSA